MVVVNFDWGIRLDYPSCSECYESIHGMGIDGFYLVKQETN